jgi:hypothetical protein
VPRTQTKRTLGEETFQREIMGGLINGGGPAAAQCSPSSSTASLTENLLWNIERTVSNVFIPFLNSKVVA